MTSAERRGTSLDRRLVPRGGRRQYDLPGRYPNILVAESYDGARIPCVKYLDRFGFAVDEAAEAGAALSKIAERRSHIVIVEAGLPNAPITRIVEQLRDGTAKPVPVIVMTSELDAGVVGLDGIPLLSVLAKPFSLSSMLQEIRRLLREQPPIPMEVTVCSSQS